MTTEEILNVIEAKLLEEVYDCGLPQEMKIIRENETLLIFDGGFVWIVEITQTERSL